MPSLRSDINATSLTDTAYLRLRKEILECTLMPGERVTESMIIARLKLGKSPVREALQRLVRENLVLVVARQGYQVAPITLRDVEEVFELRSIIEPATVVQAIGHLDSQQLHRLDQLCRKGYRLGDSKSMNAFLNANAEFHLTIAQASGNRRLADLVAQLLDESERLIRFGMLLNPRSEEAIHEHQELLEAIAKQDREAARRIALEQVESARRMVADSLIRHSALREVPIGAP